MQIYTIEKIGSIYQENTESPFRDSLTGLFNHGFFLAYVEQELQRFKRYGKAFSLAVVDVDSFGLFNHRYGAIKGDRTLKEIAAIIKEKYPLFRYRIAIQWRPVRRFVYLYGCRRRPKSRRESKGNDRGGK